MTASTKVIAISHVTASVGDLFPAKELCRLARERGVLSVVDAAQSFGVLHIDCRLAKGNPARRTSSCSETRRAVRGNRPPRCMSPLRC